MPEEKIAEALAPQPDDPQMLTDEEMNERDALLAQGFRNWTKKWVLGRVAGSRGKGLRGCSNTTCVS